MGDPLLADRPGPAQHPQGSSSEHWLGTDQLGRDVWSRLVYAGRVDLKVGFLAVLLPFLIGTVLGSLAGFYGGKLDTLVGYFVNVVVAFPFYVLIIAILFALGPGERSIYIAITFVGWVSYTRIMRAEILVAKRREYVEAARVAGLRDSRIIVRHLLPNVIMQAVIFAMSDIVLSLAAIVTLGYIGLGIQPPTPDWGTMIAGGQNFITTKWQLSTIPRAGRGDHRVGPIAAGRRRQRPDEAGVSGEGAAAGRARPAGADPAQPRHRAGG